MLRLGHKMESAWRRGGGRRTRV
ncbi:hypothetical protein E2C01_054804 [Portunus trituberculatus]|uniref:Uncharacterized protein n=1 Tax=Portunus trituberculatus TaxID=210409 RepID=A0A5B7GUX5_PORTR|nr:hypothetical protein [Portunus trituberculatus]